MQKSLFSRAQALTPESIIFLVLFIVAGLIATVMDLEIFSPNSNPAQEESLELWAALALLSAVGSMRAAPARRPSTSLQSEVRLDV